MRKLFSSTMGAIAAIVVLPIAIGLRVRRPATPGRTIKSAWSEVLGSISAAPISSNLVNTVKAMPRGGEGPDRSDQRARERRQHQGPRPSSSTIRRPSPSSGGAGPVAVGAVAVAGRRRKLRTSSPTRLPRSAGAAGRNREPDRCSSQSLHQVGAGVQHYRAFLPVQPDGDAVQDGRETQFRCRQRKGDQCAADGRLLEAARGATGGACANACA